MFMLEKGNAHSEGDHQPQAVRWTGGVQSASVFVVRMAEGPGKF
jgi:hypothetical protein